MPALGAMRPVLQRALGRARDLGLRVRIPQRCGLPLCLMPPEFYECNEEFAALEAPTVEHDKAKPPQCADCRFDARCGGVWRRYLEARGSDEIVPVRA